ncbi:MAG: VWA domain-containing protein [Terriglobales bacterium]
MNLRRAVHTATLFVMVLLLFAREVGVAQTQPQQSAQAQTSQPPSQAQTTAGGLPVIKAETRLVLVDAIVTDKKGNYVSDLTQNEFRVWEDDAEQPIKTFSFENSAADVKDRPQYMVLFFDNSNVRDADQKRKREIAAKFVEANAGPNRYIAVLDFGSTLNVAQNFTADAERLKQVVLNDKFSTVSTDRDSVRVASMAGLESTFKAEGDFEARTLLLGIRSVARKLAPMPGRKSLILLSSGFMVTARQQIELSATIDACNKANVAIYPVALRGLTNDVTAEAYVPGRYDTSTMGPRHPDGMSPSSTSSNDPVLGSLVRQQAAPASVSSNTTSDAMSNAASNDLVLDALAAATGGFVIVNSGDLLARMEKVAKEQSQYYVLGYTPGPSPIGTCHKLRVKVDRSGVVVRSRSVYCSVKPVDPLAGKPVEKQLVAHASSESPGNITASMQAPYFYASTKVARVELAIEIPPGAVNITKQKGKLQGSIDILGLAYKPDGTVAARFSDSVPLEFNSKKEVEEFNRKPLHYNHQFEAAPGNYDLKVVFTSGGDRFAKLDLPLVIDPYDGKQIAMSAIALSKQVYPLSQAADISDAALLEDRVPLVSRGFEFVPSGSEHFKKREPGAFYVEIYDPLLLEPNPPKLAIQVKVIDRNTGTAKVDASGAAPEVKAGNPVVALGLRLPLETLPPGAYRLELRATDSRGNAAPARSADFQVE